MLIIRYILEEDIFRRNTYISNIRIIKSNFIRNISLSCVTEIHSYQT